MASHELNLEDDFEFTNLLITNIYLLLPIFYPVRYFEKCIWYVHMYIYKLAVNLDINTWITSNDGNELKFITVKSIHLKLFWKLTLSSGTILLELHLHKMDSHNINIVRFRCKSSSITIGNVFRNPKCRNTNLQCYFHRCAVYWNNSMFSFT